MVQPANNLPQREWLKSSDVRKMLGISHGALQNLRIKGVLPYHKLGTIMFYRYEDIARMLNGDKAAGSWTHEHRARKGHYLPLHQIYQASSTDSTQTLPQTFGGLLK